MAPLTLLTSVSEPPWCHSLYWLRSLSLHGATHFIGFDVMLKVCFWNPRVSILRPAGFKNRLERNLEASILKPAGLKIETRGFQKQTRAKPGSIIFETRGCQFWDPRVSKTDFDFNLRRNAQKQTRAKPGSIIFETRGFQKQTLTLACD